MMTNQLFLDKILASFKAFIETGTSRSTAKLKPLHGAIAKDIAERLGVEYTVKSLGFGDQKEASIEGRYVNKRVDITIMKDGKALCGIAVKFVMQNYSQNSNNYFENMLGETANIRTAGCPYFQIFIIPNELPYYDNKRNIIRWETFKKYKFKKYNKLSQDDTDRYLHVPNKTLVYVFHIKPEVFNHVNTLSEYLSYYRAHVPTVQPVADIHNEIKNCGTVILNDYELFINKVYHTIKAL